MNHKTAAASYPPAEGRRPFFPREAGGGVSYLPSFSSRGRSRRRRGVAGGGKRRAEAGVGAGASERAGGGAGRRGDGGREEGREGGGGEGGRRRGRKRWGTRKRARKSGEERARARERKIEPERKDREGRGARETLVGAGWAGWERASKRVCV